MRTTAFVDQLYRAPRATMEIVDVPELAFVVVEGTGAPESDAFQEAVQAVYRVTYAAHFQARERRQITAPIMPLEALWWVDADLTDPRIRERAIWGDDERSRWHWKVMIMQPDPIDAALVASAVDQVGVRYPSAALATLRYCRWDEGRCAQILHVGPYANEPATLARLHDGIAAAGYRPRGRHHEIYLGDPRRVAPERLRTILRMPVDLA